MLIFYIDSDSSALQIEGMKTPVVIIDALSSDDKFSITEIETQARLNAPSTAELLRLPKVYSCEYSMQFDHIGIPLGAAFKTKFSGTLKSPPAGLVTAFSPKYLTSAQSTAAMMDPLDKIANPQTTIVYAAMVVKSLSGSLVSRKFIIYAAPLYPDSYGTTTTMILSGAMIDDVLLRSSVGVQIDKKTPLATQLDAFLSNQNPPLKGNYDQAPQALSVPATEILFQPMKLKEMLSEICLQNKMLFDISNGTVTFNSVDQSGAPPTPGYNIPQFSFLGSKGALAWGLGVENYANVKFNSSIFDCKIFGKISLYNDIKSAFFEGLMKRPGIKVDIYDAWIIRYFIRWSRDVSTCEATATNNWLMAQFRIDSLLEKTIYLEAAGRL